MEIETGIPLPTSKRNRRHVPHPSPMRDLIVKMIPGQSVLCARFSEYESARRTATGLGFVITSERNEKGWRIWRLE